MLQAHAAVGPRAKLSGGNFSGHRGSTRVLLQGDVRCCDGGSGVG